MMVYREVTFPKISNKLSGCVGGLRILELDVPTHKLVGESVKLTCRYRLYHMPGTSCHTYRVNITCQGLYCNMFSYTCQVHLLSRVGNLVPRAVAPCITCRYILYHIQAHLVSYAGTQYITTRAGTPCNKCRYTLYHVQVHLVSHGGLLYKHKVP